MTIHTKVDQFEQGSIITFYLVRILIHIAIIANLRYHARIYEHKSHPSTLPYSSSEQMQFA